MQQSGNAFVRRQGANFIPCDGCFISQECGTRGHCYRDLIQQYGGQCNGAQNCLAGAPDWQTLIEFHQRGSQ